MSTNPEGYAYITPLIETGSGLKRVFLFIPVADHDRFFDTPNEQGIAITTYDSFGQCWLIEKAPCGARCYCDAVAQPINEAE